MPGFTRPVDRRATGARLVRIPFLLFACLAFAQALPAQTIEGTLLDDETGERISAGTVTLLREGNVQVAETQTTRGVFVLQAARSGAYRLRAERAGYAMVISSPMELKAGDTIQVQFRLSKRAVVLDPIVVTPRREGPLADYYDRLHRRPWAQIVTREEIDRRHEHRASDLLRDIPGVLLFPVRGSAGSTVALRRGCTPAVFVDGILVPTIARVTIDDLVRPSMLEGIEVYKNSLDAPPQYGLIGPCGAILFWTRKDG